MTEESADQQRPLGNTISKNATTAEGEQQIEPESSLKSDIAPPPNYEKEGEHCRPDQTPLAKTILEGVGLAILAAYTTYAALQWNTMNKTYDEIKTQTAQIIITANATKDAANLNRQLVEGTYQAMLSPRMEFLGDGLMFGFENRGKVIATGFISHFTVSRETWPGRKQIGRAHSFDVGPLQIPPSDVGWYQKRIVIPGWHADLGQAIHESREVINVRGTYQFDNGFGAVSKYDICQTNVWNSNDNGGGSGGFTSCTDADHAAPQTKH
jgi:hypothetical protein